MPEIKDVVIIAINIKTTLKPSFPFSGVKPTITKVLTEVKSAPKISGSKFFGLAFQGLVGVAGVGACKSWVIILSSQFY
jgi:hypothetical protein